MAEVFLNRLSDFFAWCCRRGLRSDNPCREITVDKPTKRKIYISDAQFYAIREALLIGDDGRKNPRGEMMQCYIDLCYLLYQRTTEIRLLKWSCVGETSIFFKPTKTEQSSGATVQVPIGAAVRRVLDQAMEIGVASSIYVIHQLNGQAYGASGVRSAWDRACKRAKVEGITLKDLRAKAATDAKKAGYDPKQIQIGLAHTNEKMTEQYIKHRETPVSEVIMDLPRKPQEY